MDDKGAPKASSKDADSISISDLEGLPKRRPSIHDTILFGKIRNWQQVSTVEWCFLASGVVSALTSLGFTIERMVSIIQPQTPDFTFALLLIVNAVFCIWYLFNGLFREDFYEIGVFLLSNFIVLIYVVINFSTSKTDRMSYKLARLIVIIVLSIINIPLGVKVIKKYWIGGHFVFAIASGDALMTKICLNRFFCGTMLVLDLNLHLDLLLLVLKSGTEWNTKETIILATGTAVSFVWAILGYIALRTEIRVCIWLFWVLWGLGPGYIIYKFIQTSPTGNVLFPIVYTSGCIALIIRITLLIATIYAYTTFNQGYKERLASLKSTNSQKKLRDSYIQFPSPDTEYSTIRLPY